MPQKPSEPQHGRQMRDMFGAPNDSLLFAWLCGPCQSVGSTIKGSFEDVYANRFARSSAAAHWRNIWFCLGAVFIPHVVPGAVCREFMCPECSTRSRRPEFSHEISKCETDLTIFPVGSSSTQNSQPIGFLTQIITTATLITLTISRKRMTSAGFRSGIAARAGRHTAENQSRAGAGMSPGSQWEMM
ncbi:hypothetical protein EYF80_011444 [Liparis tanakae]|uniref:Uncharacterized protein n=1 Tax=Liparis tanakae TaxID=230148 RepID=A0A4Z2IL58_9TELE|nr:hypothetical protein EYF80_011444 [Liparis tanakae]